MIDADGTAIELRLVGGDEIDVAAHAALQQQVFAPVLKENNIPLERLGADVFAWKLMPPAGPARIGIVERDGQLVSSCTAYPVQLGAADSLIRGWHICDAVTAAEVRGRGLYHRILEALCQSFSPDEWLFGFPNHLSMGAFERGDFLAVKKVPLWVRPVFGRGGAMPVDVAPISEFGPEHDDFAMRLRAVQGLTALRSSAFLTWRYLAHPYFDYRCFELRRGDRIDGIAVVNRMEARGRVSMWVMELSAVDGAGRRALAKAVRTAAATTGCDVILSMASERFPGALRLPSLFMPKQHILMVRSGGLGASQPPGQWDVHTGDWDTF